MADILMILGAALGLILTASQMKWAIAAYQVGEPYGLGLTVSALAWQESSFCRYKINSWSRGCLGLKRRTARLFDSTVTRKQLTDDNERNLRDGLSYLEYCKENTAGWSEMVYCYHYGLPAELAVQTEYEIVSDGYVKAIAFKVTALQNLPEDSE